MKELPILKHRKEIVDTVLNNQVTIIVGETGSGKTTQIPQFLYQAYSEKFTGKVGITQPRRIAATSVAHFVANQLGCNVGEEVGYKIRFDDNTTEGTFIKFLTDGMLLREMQADSDLKSYSIIIVDEAHERNLNVDFLLGLLKDLLKRRSDLKLIVSSATIEEEKFSQYFSGAPVINVSGRTYPIEVHYHSYQADDIPMFFRADVERITEQVLKIHSTTKTGDILIFLTGEDDISRTVSEIEKQIEERKLYNLVCFSLYGSMNFQDQMKVFEKIEKRKVVVATNIAETSVTIDGVVYVVDAGYVKQMNFHPDKGIQSLDRVSISKASAEQRAGRAGRTQPGECHRLYSYEAFDKFDEYTIPEIKRTDLASVVLQMRMLDINDVENFDFIDPPDKELFSSAYETLIALGALDRDNGVTLIGMLMAELPLEPRIARMVIAAQDYDCTDEVCTIAGFLSNRQVFNRPRNKEEEADTVHARFKDPSSDFLTMLKVYKEYIESDRDTEWCYENFLNYRVLKEVEQIRDQLFKILERNKIPIFSSEDREKITKAVAAGLVQNVYKYTSHWQYKKVEEEKEGIFIRPSVFLHPSSSLFKKDINEWIVAADIVETNKVYARNCTWIKPEWIKEIAPHLCTKDYQYGWHDRGTGKVDVVEWTFFNGSCIGEQRVKLDADFLKDYQAKRIAEAQKEGWIKLTFLEDQESFSGSWKARKGDIVYHLSLIAPKQPIKGKFYYCSVREDFLGTKCVSIEFEILNFD